MTQTPLFRKVLVANRGEIACRVMRTLHRLGITSVAIYHHVDRDSPHVKLAHEAYELTHETPVAAYLDGAAIIRVAEISGATAIHPGYGFLAENAAFAAALDAANLVFIGPKSDVIELMGNKIRARAFVLEHGFPVAPSVDFEDSQADFEAAAKGLGFPLLIKAAAGGGGKGMRVVRDPQSLLAETAQAAAEAERYFGDGRVYAERFIERPRHIEVQVLGDGNGGVIHLFERECSVQRRFQKIVEESPAPRLPDSLREQLCETATAIAAAAKYANAGTIEFILGPDQAFFFLEMNTRLQVEHPVTEMVTGVDLVEAQIRIAAGGGLPYAQADIVSTGHAIECRICAEVPNDDFHPATGTILRMEAPTGANVRFDNGYVAGQQVSAAFDSMLAKLIVRGDTREEALAQGATALKHLLLLGVDNNVEFLARLVAHPEFRAGDIDTGFLERHGQSLFAPRGELDPAHLIIVAALQSRSFRQLAFETPEPYASMGGWRN